MRVLFLLPLLPVFSLAACPLGVIPCGSDDDCGTGGRCDVDTAVCVSAEEGEGEEGEGEEGEGEGEEGEGEGEEGEGEGEGEEGEGEEGEGEGEGEGDGEVACVDDGGCDVGGACFHAVCVDACALPFAGGIRAGRQSLLSGGAQVIGSPGGVDVTQQSRSEGLLFVPPLGGRYVVATTSGSCALAVRPLDETQVERIADGNDINLSNNQLRLDEFAGAFVGLSQVERALSCGSDYPACDDDDVVGFSAGDSRPLLHRRFDVVAAHAPLSTLFLHSKGGGATVRSWRDGAVAFTQRDEGAGALGANVNCAGDECFPGDVVDVGCGDSCDVPAPGCAAGFDNGEGVDALVDGAPLLRHMCSGDVDFFRVPVTPVVSVEVLVRVPPGARVRINSAGANDVAGTDVVGDAIVVVDGSADLTIEAIDMPADGIVELVRAVPKADGGACFVAEECDGGVCVDGVCTGPCTGTGTCRLGADTGLCVDDVCLPRGPTLTGRVAREVVTRVTCDGFRVDATVVFSGTETLELQFDEGFAGTSSFSCSGGRCTVGATHVGEARLRLRVVDNGTPKLVVALYTQPVVADPDGDGVANVDESTGDVDVDGFDGCVDFNSDNEGNFDGLDGVIDATGRLCTAGSCYDDDADGDQLPNVVELDNGLDFFVEDTDGDGLRDGNEADISGAAMRGPVDDDHDGIPNRYQPRNTDGAGLIDARTKDEDGDGIDRPADLCPKDKNVDVDGDGNIDSCPRVLP